MLMLVDVGNTNICVSYYDFNTKVLSDMKRISTREYRYFEEKVNLLNITEIVLSSVVPNVSKYIIDIASHHEIKLFNVLAHKQNFISVIVDDLESVGADLICDAAGVSDEALIVDLGTATKYLYVKNRVLMGVVISPGVVISLKALTSNTALLGSTDINVPKKVLGNKTSDCMKSGVTYAVASEVDGMIKRIRREVNNNKLKVIATGGLAEMIIPLCDEEISFDSMLLFRGLLNIYFNEKGE